MKRTVLIFGLISGAISSGMMVASMPFADRIGYDRSEIVGYTILVLSFLLVFFGIRSYRDSIGGGYVTFSKGFIVGISITLISSVLYVVTWELLFINFFPDFMDKYGAYVLQKAKASGASPAALQAKIEELKRMKEMYNNPLINAAMTFIEPFPVGLVMTLVSAAILRKKPSEQPAATPQPAA